MKNREDFLTEDEWHSYLYYQSVEDRKKRGEWWETPEDFSKAIAKAMTAPLSERKVKETELTEEQQKKIVAYCSQARMMGKQVFKHQRPTFELNLMPLKEAKAKVWAIIKAESIERGKYFIIDEYNRPLLDQLTKYFIRSTEYEGQLTKGLCIFGDVGRGKTFILECFKKFAADNQLETAFDIFDIKSIAREAHESGLDIIPRYTNLIKAYDDVGFEEKVQHFGNKACVFTELIQIQYNKFTHSGKVCHMTTNLNPYCDTQMQFGTLKEKYGDRVFDRCNGMFNYHFLGGVSKR